MMTGRIHSPGRLWTELTAPLGFAVVLALAGCGGGGTDAGDANYSQKFEAPTAPAPEVKVVRARPSKRDANELSLRERRALKEGKPQ